MLDSKLICSSTGAPPPDSYSAFTILGVFWSSFDDRENAPYSEEVPYLESIEGLAVITQTARSYLYSIRFPDYLYIKYRDEPSWIEMNRDTATLHASGYVYTSSTIHGALTVHGALSERRVPDLVPRDYQER